MRPLIRNFPSSRGERRGAPPRVAKTGQTGYPIVDAGMRELWQTGFMHNRVRMVVASFLTKHCLLNWREGEAWFWDCLVDADLASNRLQLAVGRWLRCGRIALFPHL